MSDLISRSALIEALNKYVQLVYDCDGIDDGNVVEYQQLHEDKTSYIIQGFSEAFEILQEQPIAYDVDAVVEELESQAEQYRKIGFRAERDGVSNIADKYYGKQRSMLDVIEIVKGGVND